MRDSRIEVLRLVAMFSILVCHFTIHSGWNLQASGGWQGAFANMLVEFAQIGVVIFFLISGYFLVNKPFSWLRLFKTWIQVFLYSVLCFFLVTIGYVSGHFSSVASQYQGHMWIITAIDSFLPVLTREYWFITAYVIMLLLSPFLNLLMRHARKTEIRFLIIGLVIASALMLVGLGQTAPFSATTYAITCYLIGAYIRTYREDCQTIRWYFLLISGILLVAWLVITNYLASLNFTILRVFGWDNIINNRTPEIIFGTLVFAYITSHDEHQWSSPFINYCATGVFGIYLLHESHPGYIVFWSIINPYLPDVPQPGLRLLVGLAVCIVLYVILLVFSLFINRYLVKPVQNMILRAMTKSK